jgi:hypothetical protein
LASEDLLGGAAKRITKKAIELAEAGDIAAIKICMDRFNPVRRGRPTVIELPPINVAADAVAAMAVITAAMAAGDLSPTEAQEFAAVVDASRAAIELLDVERGLATLEGRFK